ncbi:hypothetical protein [Roseateles sp.]|uniref:hypothetical protein n=1 Tax=Roseateles sp. TaxID=1971397 RepID=UPI00326492C6
MLNAEMAYPDTLILESDLAGLTKQLFEVVALAGMEGAAGAVVVNQFGMEADMEQQAHRVHRPFTRLLIGIEDSGDLAAIERVRAALSWPSYPPF